MQPNLLCHPIPYLWRDEIKHYLRGYFNAFAVAFYPDTCLRDGQSVTVSNAATYFGPMSCAIQSHAATGEIRMTVEPPRRNPPSAIHARFRHPEERPIKQITVNGEEWTDFDVEKELVHPGKLEGTTEIIAYY